MVDMLGIELLGFVLGLLFILPSFYLSRKWGTDGWVWAAAAISLPFFYVGFGLLANDWQAIRLELMWGAPYIITGAILLLTRARSAGALYLLAGFWFVHAAYDFWHDHLFINPGVWEIYPAFCAAVDLSVATYLVYLARRPVSA